MATYYDNASLVMIPSGYKDDKLYSIKPTDGSGDFTFSRDGAGASPATRVNASGLIEKGRTNSYTYSQDFSNAIWSKARGSVTTNVISAPDGTTTADLFTEDTSTGTHDIRQGLTTTSGGFYMFSIYVKANGRNVLDVYVGGANKSANFNLITASVTGGTAAIRKIEDAGGGWYRVSVGVLAASTTTTAIWILNNGSTQSYTGDGVSGMYFWGAQAEQSLVATDYIETTTAPVSAGLLGDMPRLDYSGGATCGSLLLEPSRVNIHTNSEYFGASAWTKLDASITSNDTTSPEGLLNASKLVESATTAPHRIYEIVNITSGQSYTQSVFVKDAGRRYFQIMFGSKLSGTDYANFDLQEGTITQEVGSVNAKIEDFGNGWYRCSATATASVTSSEAFYYHLANSGTATRTPSYTGDGTSGVYIFGAMVEQASYPTSYIPTYGSASTRGADSCSKTSISSLIGQTEGTLFAEFNYDGNAVAPATNEVCPIYVGTGLFSNGIYITIYQGDVYGVIRNGGVVQAAINGGAVSEGNQKVAISYAGNDVVLYLNGTQVGADTSATIPSSDRMYIGSVGTSTSVTGFDSKQALLFKTRLTNAELAALTA